MYLKHIFVYTCQFIILLNFTHTYVLLAANLDDFKSIAKKFVPNKLAEQLTNMAAQSDGKTLFHRQQVNKQQPVDSHTVNDEYSDEITEAFTKPGVGQAKTTLKKRFAIKDQMEAVDFDQLVDRVRQELEVKLTKKLKEELKKDDSSEYYYEEGSAHKDVENDKNVADIETNENSYAEEVKNIKPFAQIDKTTQYKVTASIGITENTPVYYEDDVAEPDRPALKGNEEMLLKEADLTKIKDSYEDYVIPEKDNIFESDAEQTTQTKTTKTYRVPSEQQSRYKAQIPKKGIKVVPLAEKKSEEIPLSEDLDYEVDHKSEEKAKTGSIYDEPDRGHGNKPKKLKGTMIPTREYYKMSSPNYLVKMPVVAEKYDFNEPLPERDREPENLKHFGNPEDSINKKIKLSSNLKDSIYTAK